MFQQILRTIAATLEKAGIPYMVIGGQAVLVYGEPRLTRDVDITLGIGLERLADVLNLVGQLGWDILVDAPTEFAGKTMVLPCREPESGIRIDLIFSFSDYERKAIQRSREVLIGDVPVRFTSVEDLIVHKIVAGRPRDMEDVANLLTKNPDMNIRYIRTWLGRLERALFTPLRNRFDSAIKSTER